jgi:hypothetical protein
VKSPQLTPSYQNKTNQTSDRGDEGGGGGGRRKGCFQGRIHINSEIYRYCSKRHIFKDIQIQQQEKGAM